MALDLNDLINSLSSAKTVANSSGDNSLTSIPNKSGDNNLIPVTNTSGDSTSVAPLTVTASVAPPVQPSDPPPTAAPTQQEFQRSIYNNQPEQQLAAMGQAQNPQHAGAFGMKGTLRNVLGSIGDALIMSQGGKPLFQQRVEQERLSDAMTGFQSNPNAAAGRLAAVPGGQTDALQMYQDATQDKLRQTQQDNNNLYRQNMMQSRNDAIDNRVTQNTQDRINGTLAAAARTGDPNIFQKAVKAAKSIASGTNLTDGTALGDSGRMYIPESLDEFSAGTGLTASQQARNATSQDSIAERGQAAAGNLAARLSDPRRVTPQTRQPTQYSEVSRIAQSLDQNGGDATKLPAGDQAIWNNFTNGKTKTKLTIPGLNNGNNTSNSSGGRPTPTAADLAYVRAHPESRGLFQQHFGVAPK